MREHVVRAAGPAILVVVEHEAPLRVSLLGSGDEEIALASWLEEQPDLLGLVMRAVALQDRERAERWRDELARPDGVHRLVEDLVRRLSG